MISLNLHRAPVVAALVLALLWPATALAAPSSARVATDQAALARAISDYQQARERIESADRAAAAASARLDALMARQERLQRKLNRQAALSYRAGHLPVVALLTGSIDFEDFANRWFFLTRVNAENARTLAQVQRARAHSLRSARTLMAAQQRQSVELRALERQVKQARARLSGSKAAYDAYRRRMAARPAVSSPATPRVRVGSTARKTARGGWGVARCSNYGPGSYGHRTANGTVVGPDSMIVAHKTLPFGTVIEFEYGGRRAVAVVADRGPYVAGREFDLGPGWRVPWASTVCTRCATGSSAGRARHEGMGSQALQPERVPPDRRI